MPQFTVVPGRQCDVQQFECAGGIAAKLARAGQQYRDFNTHDGIFDIYVEDLASGQVTALTDDGSESVVNGTSDWVYEEELSCRDGFRWSPDGRNIAYWQSDTKGTGIFYLINNIDKK